MTTIAEHIIGIGLAKSAIKTAIGAKGVTVPASAKLADCPALIASIQTGNNGEFPVEGSGPVCVTFIDYKGNILKKHYGNPGFNATAPSDPVVAGMVFAGWNLPYNDVQYDTIVGALFYTVSNKLEIDTIKNSFTGGLTQTLKLYKDDSSLMTVEWGDGNTSSTTAVGAVTLTNTLAAAGNYTVKVSIAAGGVYRLYSGTSGTGIMGQNSITVNYACLAVRFPQTGISLTSGLGDTAFGYCSSLLYMSIYGLFTNVAGSFCNRCYNLNGLVLPNTITSIGYQAFYGVNASLISTPISLTSILSGFAGCRRLSFINALQVSVSNTELAGSSIQEAVYSQNLTTIAASSFSNCSNLLKIIILCTTPPSLANVSAFVGVPNSCVIYVRKNTAALYAVATNWSTIYSQYQFVELNY